MGMRVLQRVRMIAPEGQKVHHGCVDPRATVHPQTQRHEHERQDSGWDGHDDAGTQTPQQMYYQRQSNKATFSSCLYFISLLYALSIMLKKMKLCFNAINAGAGLGLDTPFTTAASVSLFLEKDCVYLDPERIYDHIKRETLQSQTSVEKILCS